MSPSCKPSEGLPLSAAFKEVFATDDNLVIVMEHASGGQLDAWISRNGRFTEDRARSVFLQLVGAVAYCHRQIPLSLPSHLCLVACMRLHGYSLVFSTIVKCVHCFPKPRQVQKSQQLDTHFPERVRVQEGHRASQPEG